jgi:FAD/FMN-containing dehydrogenase
VDNLISVDIVTADGTPRRASAQENADLFWALRGGGGNFGIVTSFEYRLHPVGPQVMGGMVLHTLDQAPAVLRFYRDFCATLPDQAAAFAGVLTAPGGPPVVALILGYNGPLEEGERVLAPARAFGTPMMDTIGPMSYVERQGILDDPNAIVGLQRYWKSGFATELSDELIDLVCKTGAAFSSPLSAMLFIRVHGQATRVPVDETAFGARQAQWDFNVVGQWSDPAESQTHIAWTRAVWAQVEPLISGSAYINHIAGDDSPEKVRASYGPGLARLSEIKAKYDPTNLFRINANIAPA